MNKHIIKIGGSMLMTGLLLWAVFLFYGIGDFLEIISNVNRPLLAVYLCLSVTALVLRALRYRVLLRDMTKSSQPLSLKQAIIVAAIRNALVDFLPARIGEASYIYVVSRYGVAVTAALSSFGFCFILDIVILLIIIGLAIPFGFGTSDTWDMSHFIAGAGIGLSGVLTLVILVLFGDKLLAFAASASQRWAKTAKIFSAWSAELKGVRESGSAFSLVLLTLGLRLAKYISLYVVLLAVVMQWGVGSADLPALPVTVAFIAAEAGASLPVSGLMSFGAYEGAWTAVFGLVCRGACEAIPAASVALAVHLITQVAGYSVGLLAALCFLSKEFKEKSTKAST